MVTQHEKPFSILIADDDVGSREALREIVEPEGYRTHLAQNAEEALEIFRKQPIHLALFDMHMPRMTGLELLQIVHQLYQSLPCILVTADATDELRRQALRMQAYSVIPKPVSKYVLLYTMIRALDRHQNS